VVASQPLTFLVQHYRKRQKPYVARAVWCFVAYVLHFTLFGLNGKHISRQVCEFVLRGDCRRPQKFAMPWCKPSYCIVLQRAIEQFSNPKFHLDQTRLRTEEPGFQLEFNSSSPFRIFVRNDCRRANIGDGQICNTGPPKRKPLPPREGTSDRAGVLTKKRCNFSFRLLVKGGRGQTFTFCL